MTRKSRREIETALDEFDADDAPLADIDDVGIVEELADGRYRDFETGEILAPEDVEIVADFSEVDT